MLDSLEVCEQLELELERARRGSGALSIMIGELRGGSGEPSEAHRKHAISVLVRHKRQIDIAGESELGTFLLVLPETGERGALTVAERLRAAVASGFKDDASPMLSFGVATFGRHGRSSSALLSAARQALRAAQTFEQDRAMVENGEITAAMASIDRSDFHAGDGLEAVLALAETVDVHDRGAAGHSDRVGRYSMWIARELGLSQEMVERVRLAGRLHDVGNVGVSRSVLQKSGPLSVEELEAVRLHPEIGARVLEGAGLTDIGDWVLHHHERPDGEGYPDRLTAGEISLQARILGVADAYEAMTSDRAYAPALTVAAAREELQRCAGLQFDRRVVEAFTRVLDRQASESTARTAA